jgi:hypothetical protein
MTARPAIDQRDVFGLLPVAVAGLAQLEQSAPLWGDRLEWTELVGRLRVFEERWSAAADAAGWTLVELWGLDPVAPRARLSRMGGAWLASLRNHQVIQVDPDAIRLVTRTSARLSVYRPGSGAVLGWEISHNAATASGGERVVLAGAASS